MAKSGLCAQAEIGKPEIGKPEIGKPEIGQPEIGQPEIGKGPSGASRKSGPPNLVSAADQDRALLQLGPGLSFGNRGRHIIGQTKSYRLLKAMAFAPGIRDDLAAAAALTQAICDAIAIGSGHHKNIRVFCKAGDGQAGKAEGQDEKQTGKIRDRIIKTMI